MAVPPVLADLVSAPNAPNRSGRGGRDRRSKFYELSDNLCVSEMAAMFASDLRVGLVFSRRRLLVADENTKFGAAVAAKYTNLHHGFGQLGAINDGRELFRKWVEAGMRENWIGEPSAVMVRRVELAQTLRFNRHVRQAVDFDLWMRVIPRTHVGFVDAELLSYRTGHANETRSNYGTGRAWLDRLWMLEGFAQDRTLRAEYPELDRALRAERRAVWRTLAKIGRSPTGARLPITPYWAYLTHRGRAALRWWPRS